MRLHESPDTYLELIQATANHIQIPAVHVEKDYWVTRVLKRLQESNYAEAVVFKGGTSLSKAHRLIERFSEDIDLALMGDVGASDSRRRKQISLVEGEATQDLEYRPGHPSESKHGRFRRTAHAFPMRSDAAGLGQISDVLLVEINSFANPEPWSPMPISTLIHDFLIDARRRDLVREHELGPFSIPVLSVERTLCEKLMGLVRAGYEANPVFQFRRRIRHFYDLVMIMRERQYRDFVASDGFFDLLREVGESDRASMPGAAVWLDPPLGEAMIVSDTKNLWREIGSEFRGTFKDMVYGASVPNDAEVLECLALVGGAMSRADFADRNGHSDRRVAEPTTPTKRET